MKRYSRKESAKNSFRRSWKSWVKIKPVSNDKTCIDLYYRSLLACSYNPPFTPPPHTTPPPGFTVQPLPLVTPQVSSLGLLISCIDTLSKIFDSVLFLSENCVADFKPREHCFVSRKWNNWVKIRISNNK